MFKTCYAYIETSFELRIIFVRVCKFHLYRVNLCTLIEYLDSVVLDLVFDGLSHLERLPEHVVCILLAILANSVIPVPVPSFMALLSSRIGTWGEFCAYVKRISQW